MSTNNIHEKKKIKNYTLMIVLLFFIVLFFAVSVVKFSSH